MVTKVERNTDGTERIPIYSSVDLLSNNLIKTKLLMYLDHCGPSRREYVTRAISFMNSACTEFEFSEEVIKNCLYALGKTQMMQKIYFKAWNK